MEDEENCCVFDCPYCGYDGLQPFRVFCKIEFDVRCLSKNEVREQAEEILCNGVALENIKEVWAERLEDEN
jgi:hypothetical protein